MARASASVCCRGCTVHASSLLPKINPVSELECDGPNAWMVIYFPVGRSVSSRYCLPRRCCLFLLLLLILGAAAVVPKSRSPVRIQENAELEFTLTDEDMALLNKLDEGKHFCWDPSRIA